MKLTFLGAAHEVTGSCTLIEIGGHCGVVDFGMEQGADIFVNQPMPVSAGTLEFVLLTHAHIDHSGLLPLLCKQGYSGPIYATESTCHLCNIMLRDSAHIQEYEAEWKNRKAKRRGDKPEEPLYDSNDAEAAIAQLRPCRYGETVPVIEGLSVRFSDIGHLLGSACIEAWFTEGGITKKMVFSGDVGNTHQPIIRDPQRVADADYVMIESTYGDRLHPERPDYIGFLVNAIQKVLDRGGNLVVPAFAVGRTQEMLYFIREIKERGLVKGHDGFPVYVDSPLANEATAVFQKCDPAYVDEETAALLARGVNPLVFPGLKTSVTSDESKQINFDTTPKVIISASGMCEAGRIRHHLKHNLWRPESAVLFVGYQANGTLGRILVDGADEVKIFGEPITVACEVLTMPGISGHADKNGLMGWLAGFAKKPQAVFVNHGENEVCDLFADALRAEGYAAFAPYSGAQYDLALGTVITAAEGVPIDKTKTAGALRTDTVYGKLVAAAERLLALVRSMEGRSNKELGSVTSQLQSLYDKLK